VRVDPSPAEAGEIQKVTKSVSRHSRAPSRSFATSTFSIPRRGAGAPQKRGLFLFSELAVAPVALPKDERSPVITEQSITKARRARGRPFSLNYRAYVHTAVTALTCPGADTDTRLSVNFLIAEIVRPSALRFLLPSFACRDRIIALVYGPHEKLSSTAKSLQRYARSMKWKAERKRERERKEEAEC